MDDGFTPDSCCVSSAMGCACKSCAMGGARDTCTAWLKHYYWNHMSDEKKQFLVLASGDFSHSLRIPREVGSHLRKLIPESDLVELEAPNGRVYSVEASREIDAIVLRFGWNKFVDAHHIEENDSILFVYRGNSCFKVNVFNLAGHEKSFSCSPLPSGISEPVPPFAPSHHHVKNEQVAPNPGHVNFFDPSGREKTSSCSIMGKHSSSAEEMCDDSIQIVDPPQPQIIDLRSTDDDDIVSEGTKESCRPQKRVTRSSDDDDIVSEGTEESCRPQKRVTRRCAKAQKMGSTSSPSTKSGYGARKPHHRATKKLEVGSEPLSSNLRGLFRRPYILSKQTTLRMQVRRKVVNKVQAIGSELPIFVKQMTTTNIDGTDKSSGELTFGMVYASACLPDKTKPLLLQLEGRNKQWHATLSVTSRNQRRVFTGWKEFVRDNQLKAGDICLFEVSSRNSRSLTMTVHLVR